MPKKRQNSQETTPGAANRGLPIRSNPTLTRMVLAGPWQWDVYEKAFSDGFKKLGIEVFPFKFSDYKTDGFAGRLQNKFLVGPLIRRINEHFVHFVNEIKPNIIFLNRASHIELKSVREIKRIHNPIIITYNHDNPFRNEKFIRWRNYFKTAALSEINYYCRKSTVLEAEARKIPRPKLLMQYYVEGLHVPLDPSDSLFQSDVVFVGHYENDGREEFLCHLLQNRINLRIYGTSWNKAKTLTKIYSRPIHPIYGENYVKVISGAKIALVFLSGKNHDLYTTRNFEIPACKTMVLTPANSEISKLFKEDIEAVFYDNKTELLVKTSYYLRNQQEREHIAQNGFDRVLKDEHSNCGRCKMVLNDIEKLTNG